MDEAFFLWLRIFAHDTLGSARMGIFAACKKDDSFFCRGKWFPIKGSNIVRPCVFGQLVVKVWFDIPLLGMMFELFSMIVHKFSHEVYVLSWP